MSNLRLTASTHVLSCAAAVFQTTPDDSLIRSICQFTYYEHFTPPPAVLETQDEILLANLPPKWQLVCDNQIDRPIPFDSAIYVLVASRFAVYSGKLHQPTKITGNDVTDDVIILMMS